jgi:hypothetical protein
MRGDAPSVWCVWRCVVICLASCLCVVCGGRTSLLILNFDFWSMLSTYSALTLFPHSPSQHHKHQQPAQAVLLTACVYLVLLCFSLALSLSLSP